MFPLVSISHFGAGVKGSAVVETAFAIGTLAGSFLLGILGRKIKKNSRYCRFHGIVWAWHFDNRAFAPERFCCFAAISVFMGVSIPFYHGVRTAMLQMSFPAELLGRIMALSLSITRFAMPIGLILAGTFAETVGVDTWFAISGGLAIMLAFVIVRSPSLKGCCE